MSKFGKLAVSKMKQKGFSILEVLVAIIVLSVGLLGVAGLVGNSVRLNHQSYTRSQAAYLASNMTDRMRGNTLAVIAGDYDGAGYNGTGPAAPDCDAADPCDPEDLADRDTSIWGAMLASTLAQGSGTIACAINPPPGGLVGRPTVNGTCQVTVFWNEATSSGSTPYRFDLVFQP